MWFCIFFHITYFEHFSMLLVIQNRLIKWLHYMLWMHHYLSYLKTFRFTVYICYVWSCSASFECPSPIWEIPYISGSCLLNYKSTFALSDSLAARVQGDDSTQHACRKLELEIGTHFLLSAVIEMFGFPGSDSYLFLIFQRHLIGCKK